MKRLAIVLALFAVSPVALAQPGKQQISKRDQIKKRIRIARGNTLTVELNLDEPTANKLFPLLAKYDDELDALLGKKAEINHRLREAKPGDPNVDRVIDEAVANQKALWVSEEHRLAELRKILAPAQTAKLLVVLPEFEQKIRNQLRKAIEKEQSPNDEDDGPPPPNRPRGR